MEIETLTTPTAKLVRLDAEVIRFIEAAQLPRESYTQALRRLLGIERK